MLACAPADAWAGFFEAPFCGVPGKGVMVLSTASRDVVSGSVLLPQELLEILVSSSFRNGTLELDCVVGEPDM